MANHHEARSRRFLAGWIEWVSRSAWAVIALALLATAGAAYYTAKNLEIDASIDKMLSKELPFRKTEAAISKAFPQSNDVLSVIVEGEDDETADRAAVALTARLSTMTNRFQASSTPKAFPFSAITGCSISASPSLRT